MCVCVCGHILNCVSACVWVFLLRPRADGHSEPHPEHWQRSSRNTHRMQLHNHADIRQGDLRMCVDVCVASEKVTASGKMQKSDTFLQLCMWHDLKFLSKIQKKKSLHQEPKLNLMQNSYFTVSLYAEYITAMSKLKVPEKYHNDFFSAKNMGFIRQKGRWRGFQNWNAVFVQIIVGIIHIPKCSAIPHSLHGPQTRIRWEWMKPIMYFFFSYFGTI